jgi:hypothetical protein
VRRPTPRSCGGACIEVRRVLSEYLYVELIELISSVVTEFHAIDRHADAFRYATNPKGDPQLAA